ncbi:hypothetical protein IWQ61_007782 [Dispira simplex]|nr:hypothetical protein IWQ61_007782 [Dispira simplex]
MACPFDIFEVVWKRILERHKYNPTITENRGMYDKTLGVMVWELVIAAIYADNVIKFFEIYAVGSTIMPMPMLSYFLLALVLEKKNVADYINGLLNCNEVLEWDCEVCKHLKIWYSDYSGLAASFDIKTLEPTEPKNKKYIIEDGAEWNPRKELAKRDCWEVGPICKLEPDDPIDIEQLKWTGIDNKPFSDNYYSPILNILEIIASQLR